MLSTNINIISNETENMYHYLATLLDKKTFVSYDKIKYRNTEDCCHFIYEDNFNTIKVSPNIWNTLEFDDERYQPVEHESDTTEFSTVRIEFPVYSLETDTDLIETYQIEIFTFINGKKVILNNTQIIKTDNLVHECIKKLENEYYEYIDISFINPFEFCYSDEWQDFRHNILEEPLGINNTGSLLSIAITPITYNEVNDNFIKSLEHNGGVNSVMLDRYYDDDMRYNLNFINDTKYNPTIDCQLSFNRVYDSLKEYFKETYNIQIKLYVQYQLVVKDDEEVWKDINSELIELTDEYIPEYKFKKSQIAFDDWTMWNENLHFQSTINFLAKISELPEDVDLSNYDLEHKEDEYIQVLYLLSSPLYLSKEIYKFFIKTNFDEKISYKILDDMKTFNIKTVNRIEKKIINVERSKDYKSNIIRPVFFKVQDLNNITINTEVTQNIALNLDDYKSKVNSFKLKIEGVTFSEVGRNNSGVIFKIIPTSLPKENSSGNYYILDDNNELISSGSYEYNNIV